MGTKFANLQIRNIDPAEIQRLMPDCIVRELAKGWTTVLHEQFQIGQIEGEARKLSKRIDNAVLSVGYYDDDILVLNIFQRGKSVALHVSNDAYGYDAKTGNPTSFQRYLELDEGAANILKEVFKCENLEQKTNLLENLFGVPLWIGYHDFSQSSEENLEREFTKLMVMDYINESKAASKIKNKTNLRLRTEFEGMPEISSSLYILPKANGNFLVDDPNTYELQTDGSLILKKTDLDRVSTSAYPLLHTPDGATIYSSYGPESIIFEIGADEEKKWELKLKYLKVPPVLHNNKFFMHAEIDDESTIIKLNRQGHIESSINLPAWGGCHWNTFLFDNLNRMYYCCSLNEGDIRSTKLFCFDEELKPLAQLDIGDTSFDSVIDKQSGMITLFVFQNEIVMVDSNTMQVSRRKKCTEYIELILVDNKNNVYIKKGESTIELLNTNLEVISRHRLKGQIHKNFINSEGNPCLVTWNGSKWNSGKEKSMIRVFEVYY